MNCNGGGEGGGGGGGGGAPHDGTSSSSSTAVASALVISASNKAGMDDIDRERIDAIILRESERTLYMQQQKRRDEKVNERIARMKENLRIKIQEEQQKQGSIGGDSDAWKRRLVEEEINPEIETILEGRRNRSTACVIDMDMFYMACELLTQPHLKELPCCVGGGMITTSNYVARKFGVRSGMAGWIADKLVEELSDGKQKLVHVKNHFDLYKQKSHEAMTIIRQFDPKCRSYSLDEAFIDLAPYLSFKLTNRQWNHEQISHHLVSLYGIGGEEEDDDDDDDDVGGGGTADTNNNNNNKPSSSSSNSKDRTTLEDYDTTLQLFPYGEFLTAASETVALMRQKVCEATGGLTCSAGLAPSFTLAKIASDINKPNGQKIIGSSLEEDVWPFLRPLPTRKIPGIGRVSQKILSAFGIDTVQQLWDERGLVRFLFYNQATAKFLLRACLGGFGSSTGDDAYPTEVEGGGGRDNDDNAEGSSGGRKSSTTNKKTNNNLKRKGISKERTFRPGDTWSEINNRLEDIARQLGKAMEKENVFARTVSLKVKLNTFDVIQRSRTVDAGCALQKGGDLMNHATEMLHELRKQRKDSKFSLRLLGVRCSNLMDSTEVATHTANQRCMAKFLAGQSSTAVGSDGQPKSNNRSNNNTQTSSQLPPPYRLQKKRPFSPKPSQGASASCVATRGDGPSAPSALSATTHSRFRQDGSPKPSQSKSTSSPILDQNKAVEQEQGKGPAPGSSSSQTPSELVASCPICNKQIIALSNESLNRDLNNHIDSCLNAPVIRKAVQEETKRFDNNRRLMNGMAGGGAGGQPKPKKRRLTDFFSK